MPTIADADTFLGTDTDQIPGGGGSSPIMLSSADTAHGLDSPVLVTQWDCSECVQPICWQVTPPGSPGGNDRDYPQNPGQEPDRCVPLASVFARFPPPPGVP